MSAPPGYSSGNTPALPPADRLEACVAHPSFSGQLTILLISRSIKRLEFEWHEATVETNFQNHGVSFELAKTVFEDPFAIERLDDSEDYGEERFVIVSMAEGHVLLFVAYTERGERIRIISARRATQHEQDDYFRQNA
jgi:uncharacterized protein